MCIFFLHLQILLKFVVFSFNKEQIEVERTLAFMKNEPHIPHNNSVFFFIVRLNCSNEKEADLQWKKIDIFVDFLCCGRS